MLIDFYPPPIRGLGVMPEGSDADYLRRAWISGAWRGASPLKIVVFAIAILVWWPLTVLRAAYLATRLGPSRARVSGKSPFRQFIEQLSVAARWTVPPTWYYVFEFFDDARRADAGQYLQRVQTKPYIYGWLTDHTGRLSSRAPFANKVYFAELCQRNDLPSARVVALVGQGAFHFLKPYTALPPTDLFVKIKNGRGGHGAEKWRYEAGGYRRGTGRPISAADLMSHILHLSRSAKRIVQPALVNHPELSDLNLGVLATVRVMTIRAESGGVEATHAIFRMPRVRTVCVDNLHAGGIAAAVDLTTGKLGRATDIGTRVDSCWHAKHPVSGAQIEGRALPHWPAVLELARRAHRLIGDRVVVGWDIAILPDGPCLVEGNGKPDVDIMQRHYRQGLGETRFGKLLAVHLAAHLAGNPLNGRLPSDAGPAGTPPIESAVVH